MRNTSIGLLVLRTVILCPTGMISNPCVEHNISVRYLTTGSSSSISINQHTWSTLVVKNAEERTCDQNVIARVLRVCTYNIWNTNPPAWVYQQPQRWQRYRRRLSHLSRIIVEANIDVLLLQEVRLDTTFGLAPYGN